MRKKIDLKPGEAMYIGTGGRMHKIITFIDTNPLTPLLAQGLLKCRRLAVEPLGATVDYQHVLIRDLFAASKKLKLNTYAVGLFGGRHLIYGPVAVVCRCDWENGLAIPAAEEEGEQNLFALEF
jgi:hypothetical protein